jgi:hypothetical protein
MRLSKSFASRMQACLSFLSFCEKSWLLILLLFLYEEHNPPHSNFTVGIKTVPRTLGEKALKCSLVGIKVICIKIASFCFSLGWFKNCNTEGQLDFQRRSLFI